MNSAALAFLAAALAGCMGYAPRDIAALPTAELCWLEATQRVNLSEESRRLLASELAARKERCDAAAIAQRQRDELYERTYLNQSP